MKCDATFSKVSVRLAETENINATKGKKKDRGTMSICMTVVHGAY
jgi:DNA-directed RNA polymerase alpha subunit